ncbi:beta propeller repeat protein [Hyalangium gracile]|uniref:hypothetical protein n=1 Tax=Hyalangium gracile TaxID=394092 RepID=UPI001CCE2DE5|nr:hypothetical protein [Hyalangium gracile]
MTQRAIWNALAVLVMAAVLGCQPEPTPQSLPDAGPLPSSPYTGPTTAGWHRVISTLRDSVHCFASVGDLVYAGTGSKTATGADVGGVFVSPDQGTTWKPTALNLSVSSLWATPTEVYATTIAQGLMKSVDRGETWTRVNVPNAGTTIFNAVAVSGTRLLVGVGPVVHVSDDNGATWTRHPTGMPNFSYITQFLVESGKIVATLKGGVVVSTDNGTTWTELEEGLPYNPHVTGAARVDDSLFVATTEGVYRASFSGGAFERVANGMSNNDVYALVSWQGGLFAGVGVGSYGSAYLSSDEGSTWNPFNQGLPELTPISALRVVGDSLLAGSGGSVWRTALGPSSPPPDTGPLIGTVDRVPVRTCPYWVAFDGTHLYFSTAASALGPTVSEPGNLMRAPLAGGPVETLETLQPAMRYVVVTPNHVWWTTNGNNGNSHAIRRRLKSGGPVEVAVGQQPAITQLTATDTHVWYTAFELRRIPVSAGPVEQFYVSPEGRIDSFAFDGTHAYVGENSFTQSLWRLRLSDKARELLSPSPAAGWDTYALAVDADFMYTASIYRYQTDTPRAFYRVKKDGSAPREKLLDVPAQARSNMLLHGGFLYFSQGRTLMKVPKDQRNATPQLVMADVNMERMFVHAGRLYWTDCFLQEIRSVPFPP